MSLEICPVTVPYCPGNFPLAMPEPALGCSHLSGRLDAKFLLFLHSFGLAWAQIRLNCRDLSWGRLYDMVCCLQSPQIIWIWRHACGWKKR